MFLVAEKEDTRCSRFNLALLFISKGYDLKAHNIILTHLFPMYLFVYTMKTSKNITVFWCFQGVEKECIGNKWVNNCDSGHTRLKRQFDKNRKKNVCQSVPKRCREQEIEQEIGDDLSVYALNICTSLQSLLVTCGKNNKNFNESKSFINIFWRRVSGISLPIIKSCLILVNNFLLKLL